MLGLMQTSPLLISSIITHAARHHARAEVVSREIDGRIVRTTYAALERRTRQLARVLLALGVQPGDRVATLAWNTARHVEIYYAVSGIGAVCHTLNPRLKPDIVSYIANHAADTVLFVDPSLTGLIETVAESVAGTIRTVVVMADEDHMPPVALAPGMQLLCYETLMAAADADYVWPVLDENTASGLCYTSGTTGLPKGVLYSHRSTLLHALSVNGADGLGLKARDRIAAFLQMFHVHAGSIPFLAPMAGAALLLPGRFLDGPNITALMNDERATVGWGVPTIWLGLLRYLDEIGEKLPTLRRVVVGGSAVPRPLLVRLEHEFGLEVQQNWGMTECGPLGTYNQPTAQHEDLEEDAKLDLQVKQGRALFGADVKVVDDAGRELPWDGVSAGALLIRGLWVIRNYFGPDAAAGAGPDGWFDTGDVATIDADGFVQIVDRAKDMIKTGGEWISSMELEAIARQHPDVDDVAAIAVQHPKWMERPLLVVVPKQGRTPGTAEVRAHFKGKVTDWSLPDAVVLVPELPLAGTGKVDKRALRERFALHLLTGEEAAAAGE